MFHKQAGGGEKQDNPAGVGALCDQDFAGVERCGFGIGDDADGAADDAG